MRLCLGCELGLAVGDLDAELLGAVDDFYALAGGDGVCNPVVVC